MQISSISTIFGGPITYILRLSSKSCTFRALLRPGTSNGFAPLYAIVRKAGTVGEYGTVFRRDSLVAKREGSWLWRMWLCRSEMPQRGLENEVDYLRKRAGSEVEPARGTSRASNRIC
jgi:hypothetical protein